MAPSGRDQLWVADLTYVAIPGGFAYVAVILDAWSRRVVGYAIGRSIDTRLALAALRAAIASRQPPLGCVHHSDRGSQYAAEAYRKLLATHGLIGSMSRRGNPYDNAKVESFMKTLKVEAVYPMEFESFEDAATYLPQLHRRGLQSSPAAFFTWLPEPRAVRRSTPPGHGQSSRLILSGHRGPLQFMRNQDEF